MSNTLLPAVSILTTLLLLTQAQHGQYRDPNPFAVPSNQIQPSPHQSSYQTQFQPPQQPQYQQPRNVNGIYSGGNLKSSMPNPPSPFMTHQHSYQQHAIRTRMGPCDYLLRARVPRVAGGPFRMRTRARQGVVEITAGQPIEVSIAPFSEAYQHLNFTSFIMYAKPTSNMAAIPEYMMEFMPPVAPTVNKHVGVFQVFRQYAAGAGAMKCSPTSKQEDSVGAFEDLILPEGQPKPARNKVSVLWWPDAEALKYPEIIFTANIQSNGFWYKISSTPWKVNRPIDIQAKKAQDFKRMQWMIGYMQRMKRRLDGPAPAPAK